MCDSADITFYFRYDYETDLLVRLRNNKPCISKAKGGAYVKVYADGKYYQYHNVVWVCCNGSIPEGCTVDHIDRDLTNNKLSNLRLATPRQQLYNTKGHGTTSEFKGVYYNKGAGKYFARIHINGVSKWLGAFIDETSAHAAYDKASTILHKEFKHDKVQRK